MQTNPISGFIRTILLFVSGRVQFFREDAGKMLTMEDGQRFRVFRHVKIRGRDEPAPRGVFIVRFKPGGMTVAQNIRFSLLPMMIFMGFTGFCEKYWCVDDETGLCQGVYAWQTVEDAGRYAGSIAMRFMTGRSEPGSVCNEVREQKGEKYWVFAQA